MVKLRSFTVLVDPGTAPHRSIVEGSSTTRPKIKSSVIGPMPKRANNPIPIKMKIQNPPHINLFLIQSYRLSMKKGKKIAYLFFIGGLTCTTISACQWQTRKYLAAV
jgi:hypothetical protein